MAASPSVQVAPSLHGFCLVDDLLLSRAKEDDQPPLLAYPNSQSASLEYEFFTARDLDSMTEAAALELIESGLKALSGNERIVVGLMGAASIDYVITMFALCRLGYTIFMLSSRLSAEAYASLLNQTSCSILCYDHTCQSTISLIEKNIEITKVKALVRQDLTFWPEINRTSVAIDRVKAAEKVAYIMHSSGSTGLPKPIFQTHTACLENYTLGYGLDGLLCAPLFHTYGHACLYRGLYKRSLVYLLDSSLPITSSNMLCTLKLIQPSVVFTVPYALRLAAESMESLQILSRCKIVSSAGSAVPDELGNKLIEHDIHLVSLWGATETGALMSSMRPRDDKDWSYMSIFPSARPFVWMKPLGEGLFELVALDKLKSRVVSNSSDPPNSFHTKDLFEEHPTKADRWKYLGRMDDRVALLNGEKVLPLSIEGRIRQEPIVREAVVVGAGRDLPGLLLFRHSKAMELDDEEFVDNIWPAIENANSRSESFAQIVRGLVKVIGADIEYPCTDKGTFIRQQIYAKFKEQIEDMYSRFEDNSEGSVRMGFESLQDFIITAFRNQCSVNLSNINEDFFTAGVNSLKAIQMANFIKRRLFLNGQAALVGPETIFETTNVARLSKFLFSIQQGCKEVRIDIDHQIADLITKYSKFQKNLLTDTESISDTVSSQSAIITGATGSLGCHLVSSILGKGHFHKVYCLVRADSDASARTRVLKALGDHDISLLESQVETLVCVSSDLSKETLGLKLEVLEKLRLESTLILHCAWAVNFNLNISSFEQHHINGTKNLLDFAISVRRPKPACFLFCSSISVAANLDYSITVPEAILEDSSVAANIGYAQSKFVAEHLVNNASRAAKVPATILRIGQIVGDTKLGLWNDSDTVPLIIRSCLATGTLPKLYESCSWLPVDTLATAIVDIALLSVILSSRNERDSLEKAVVYNMVNPRSFSWTNDCLPELRRAGLKFEETHTAEWLKCLGKEGQDPVSNPIVKLLPRLKERYSQQTTDLRRTNQAFAIENTKTVAPIIAAGPVIIGNRMLEKFLSSWMRKWGAFDQLSPSLI